MKISLQRGHTLVCPHGKANFMEMLRLARVGDGDRIPPKRNCKNLQGRDGNRLLGAVVVPEAVSSAAPYCGKTGFRRATRGARAALESLSERERDPEILLFCHSTAEGFSYDCCKDTKLMGFDAVLRKLGLRSGREGGRRRRALRGPATRPRKALTPVAL